MKDIMYNMRDKLDFGVAMSPTEETTESLGTYVPRSCIYNSYSSAALDVMLEHRVNVETAVAQFDRKTRQLSLTMSVSSP
jgi:hypothetical protein